LAELPGSLRFAAGAWSYIPDLDFNGADNFIVTVTDDLEGTTTQLVELTVFAGDEAAIITGDISASGNEDDPAINGTLIASDAEGLTDGTIYSIEIGDDAFGGSASINAATGAWNYIPDPDFNGADNFIVSVTDDLDGITTQLIELSVAPVNDLPSGAPAIIGSALVGEILTADTTAISDVDGLGSFSYQWYADALEIAGATAISYTLTLDEFGTAIDVEVSYTDVQGSLEILYSDTTDLIAPVIIDLQGDGFDYLSLTNSTARFDINGDGEEEQVAWSGPNDGMLVFDIDGDQNITNRSEFIFTDHAPEAQTDMEALKLVFDSNKDGSLNSSDEQWSDFAIWQDANSNGVSEEGEVRSLDEWGIESIGLSTDGNSYFATEGVYVHGHSEVMMSDGTTTTAADSEFGFYELSAPELSEPVSSDLDDSKSAVSSISSVIELQADEVILEDGSISHIGELSAIRAENWSSDEADESLVPNFELDLPVSFSNEMVSEQSDYAETLNVFEPLIKVDNSLGDTEFNTALFVDIV
jgi:hypothetical protein